MSRGRLIPSLNYRSKGLIDMSLPNKNLRGLDLIEIFVASNFDDAKTDPVKIFEVRYDFTFESPFIRKSGINFEENSRDLTRFVFNLDEYATTPKANATRVPTDDETCYLRVRGRLRGTGEFTNLGPIVVVVPYDFFSVTSPIFTMIGTAPDIGADLPDTLTNNAVNLHLPSFSQAVEVVNLSAVAGEDLYVSCAVGMPPTVVKPGADFSLNSSAVGEFFFAGKDSTPQFTIRCSVVNQK